MAKYSVAQCEMRDAQHSRVGGEAEAKGSKCLLNSATGAVFLQYERRALLLPFSPVSKPRHRRLRGTVVEHDWGGAGVCVGRRITGGDGDPETLSPARVRRHV